MSRRSIAAAWLCGLAMAACGSESTAPVLPSTVPQPPVAPVPVASVTLSRGSDSLIVSEDLAATALVTAADGSELAGRAISWSSSDTSVVRVAAYGLASQQKFASVRALKPGIATVTATVEGRSANVAFVVSPLPPATAFRWSSLGGMRDIGGLPGATNSYATAINDAGQVVGYSEFAATERAFLWSPTGGMTDLGIPQGTVSARATAVSAGGVVVGWGTMRNGMTRAFIWTPGGGMQMLASLNAGESTRANGINSRGEVAGASGQLPVV